MSKKIFFTADNHFNHANMIQHENRPFSNVDDMNYKMIQYWNESISKNDDVYILGDFVWSNPSKIIPKLNGNKYLIKGNHDKQVSQKYFVWIKDYHLFKQNDLIIALFHYPMFRWDRCHYGSYHFYGHVHSNEISNGFMNTLDNCYNVGVDANEYKPVELNKILDKLIDK